MNIRPSPIAGTWYPGQSSTLTAQIEQFLAQAPVTIPTGDVKGIVVPHAGYCFSGATAAFAFNCLQHIQPDVVAVVSPFHQPHTAPLLTTHYDAYETPLGIVPVAHDLVRQLGHALDTQAGLSLTPLGADREHALEIELPFLQHVLGGFDLLPIMMSRQTESVARALGQALTTILNGKNSLLVASSDLSHFYTQELAVKFDKALLDRLAAFDPSGVLWADSEGTGFACGRGAIAAVLWAARGLGANRVKVLKHATSGEVTGDYSAVVGYGTAVIWEENDNA